MLTKIAILLQLLDLFIPPPLPPNRRSYCLWVLIILNILFFTIMLFLKIFQCVPRRKIWNPSIKGKCQSYPVFLLFGSVFNVTDDLLILALPVAWAFKLKLRAAEKVGVVGIFATGIL